MRWYCVVAVMSTATLAHESSCCRIVPQYTEYYPPRSTRGTGPSCSNEAARLLAGRCGRAASHPS
ncbi:hypothetical protein PF005_g11373 [Phytophthora fragariae]|uniref:Bifunctional inhibitor/plant lipid transfer protein/seed storage helical domain-containing protein n=2 Tax=Phytophthora TaxID=4783 RepID=A0A6A3F964_9STRA|nr:hypothetical protein PF003_g26694 [Phytophthora fragariae]KAE9007583.1 hypothetical protein PR001_g16931 [Phytophthora rubi]KAE8941186.1 hypothetical protein PF009_g9025 [Phytophthora fragariae]KAE9011155.1 hypothetical protein PR002_g15168 [Phytophthora rubi]KAE9022650.1 hypothetical protein PF011_g4355 [Phytophthora fragariae]